MPTFSTIIGYLTVGINLFIVNISENAQSAVYSLLIRVLHSILAI